MDLDLGAIRVNAAAGVESLTVCLGAVVRAAGGPVDLRELNALLGLSFMLSYRDVEACPAQWMDEGQDVFLEPTADLWGVRLRPLHPPEAAASVAHTPEFAQHFEASYRPLIETALDHGQPVLAFRGWGGKVDSPWGCLIGRGEGGTGLYGIVPGMGEDPQPLVGPVAQAYVVEDVTPRPPAPDTAFHRMVRQAAQMLNNQVDPRFGLTTGPAAYESWAECWAKGPCAVSGDEPHGHDCFHRLAERVAAARRSGAGCLSAMAPRLPSPARRLADAWAEACERIAGLLTSLVVSSAAEPAERAAATQEQLAVLHRVRQIELNLRKQLGDRDVG